MKFIKHVQNSCLYRIKISAWLNHGFLRYKLLNWGYFWNDPVNVIFAFKLQINILNHNLKF